jgi:hypothetical protein
MENKKTDRIIPRYSAPTANDFSGLVDYRQTTPPVPGFYEVIAAEIGRIVDTKNKAYGNSFHESGEILRKFYPTGISPEQYTDALAIVRIVDKLFRIATDKTAFGENPFQDIAGYGILKCRDKGKAGHE